MGADWSITLPDANTPLATSGLQVYGKDIALGEQMKAQAQAQADQWARNAQAATASNGAGAPSTGEWQVVSSSAGPSGVTIEQVQAAASSANPNTQLMAYMRANPGDPSFLQQVWSDPNVQHVMDHSMVGTVLKGAASFMGDAWAGATGYNPVSNQFYSSLDQQSAMWRTVAGVGLSVAPEAWAASRLPEIGGPSSTTLAVEGTASYHQTTNLWTPNAGGARTMAEARAIAENNGAYIADDVHFISVEDALYDSKFGNSYATYGRFTVSGPNEPVMWRASSSTGSGIADSTGRINVWVRQSVLDSDPAITAVFGHETYEIEAFRPMFQQNGGALSANTYSNLVRPGVPNNIHWQAVDFGDQLVRDMLGLGGKQ